MFTGIVKGLGTVAAIEHRQDFSVITVDVGDLVARPEIGASVAINGACLTVTKIEGSMLSFEIMKETLKLTTFADVKVGEKVGIETPMKMGDEFGGHIVQGHVDTTAEILEKERVGENVRMRFWVSEAVGKQVMHKGSVTIDGVSLTVCDPVAYPEQAPDNSCPQTYCFDVWLLPLTLERTSLGHKQVGERVNIEIDYFVKIITSRLDGLKLTT